MAALYVLDVPENDRFVAVARQDRANLVTRVGPYFRVSATSDIVIDRRATGCRHAVWYSAVAGLETSVITQYDKNALRVENRPGAIAHPGTEQQLAAR